VPDIVSVTVETIGVAVVMVAVSVSNEELSDASIDEEMAGASVTGHTVVVKSTTVVIKTVVTPSGSEVGSEVNAPVPVVTGQFVTVAAHEIIVAIEVTDTVSVVKLAPLPAVVVFANGGVVDKAAVVVFVNGGMVNADALLLVIVALFPSMVVLLADMLVTVAVKGAMGRLVCCST
jgi:hypothetical protein